MTKLIREQTTFTCQKDGTSPFSLSLNLSTASILPYQSRDSVERNFLGATAGCIAGEAA